MRFKVGAVEGGALKQSGQPCPQCRFRWLPLDFAQAVRNSKYRYMPLITVLIWHMPVFLYRLRILAGNQIDVLIVDETKQLEGVHP